jgi:competence protein ComEA
LSVAILGNVLPELPFSRGRGLAAGVLLLLLLLLGGHVLLRAGTAAAPIPDPIVPAAPAAKPAGASGLVVHVVGAVRRPGLFRLREGSRIADAVARAGGPTRRADLELINLAAPLADGEQVVVPRRTPGGAVATPSGPAASGGAAVSSGPVHLNTATLEQLDALPGVGPVTAQKILDYRTEHGAFSSVDELDAVPGIGPARLDTLRDLVAP